MENNKKSEVQSRALNAWYKAGCRGTLEAATAFGKTFSGIKAISYFVEKVNKDFKVLIVVPTVAIKDEWTKEFTKWKKTSILKNNVIIECINTARTFRKKKYDLLVADEIHNYINGEINSMLFKYNNFDKILGLSASISNDLLYSLEQIAPICFTLDLNTAVELGLVSDFTVYNIAVDLSTKEREEYRKLTSKIDYVKEAYGKQSWGLINKRKQLLYKSPVKLKYVKKITDSFEGKYGIVFSETKSSADKIAKYLGDSCISHHSGYTNKKRKELLKSFSDGRTRITKISAARTLDEGVTLPRLEYAVIATGSSKEKQQIQRVGRCIRLDKEGKQAIIVRLYFRNTVEENWVNNSQKNFNVINIKSIEQIWN